MNFWSAVSSCLSRYATFQGRAPRSEFWYFQLFMLLVFVATALVGRTATAIAFILLLMPLLAVTVRRLHDIDRSGWWYWSTLVPILGTIVFLVFSLKRGTVGDNAFGPDPLGASEPSTPAA